MLATFLFLLVTRPVGHIILKYTIHEFHVAKSMRGVYVTVVGGWGSGDLPRENFIILEVRGFNFNSLLDNWLYNHKE